MWSSSGRGRTVPGGGAPVADLKRCQEAGLQRLASIGSGSQGSSGDRRGHTTGVGDGPTKARIRVSVRALLCDS
jgi:hypothetical protein